jgi:Transcriptional regulator PadR-like family
VDKSGLPRLLRQNAATHELSHDRNGSDSKLAIDLRNAPHVLAPGFELVFRQTTAHGLASLDRLEDKGFVKSRQGEATAERGGKRKLLFTITAPGQRALRESLQAIDVLREGLAWKGAAV